MFTLRQIEYFVSVAKTGKISQSAIDLNVSQSAITSSIKSLEEILETKLFERKQRGMTLTQDGFYLLDQSRYVMASVEQAMKIPGRSNAEVKGTLRLGISFTVSGYLLAEYYARFRRSFPNVEVKMEELPRNQIEENLVNGELDLAMILTSNLVNQEDLEYETLICSKRRLWLNSNHEFLDRASVSLRDVAEEAYVMLTVDEASNTARRYWNQTLFRPKVFFRTESVEAVRSMVANGVGVSILSDLVYRPWSLEGRRVEVITLSDEIPSLDIGLSWPAGKEFSPAEKAFRDFMNMVINSNYSDPALHKTSFSPNR